MSLHNYIFSLNFFLFFFFTVINEYDPSNNTTTINHVRRSKQLFYRIKQVRSTIGLPPKYKAVLQSLGLTRRNQITYVNVAPTSANQLAAVKELVSVELSDIKKTRQEINQERKFKPGYELIKNGMKKSYA